MSPDMKVVARPSGRPNAKATEVLNRKLIVTATRLFVKQGYTATSMEQIAVAAKAGKQTIYRRYPTKEILFKAVVTDMAENLLRSARKAEETDADPLMGIREIVHVTLDMISTPECIAIYRILVSEAQRFPALVSQIITDISNPVDESIRRLLKAARRSCAIRQDLKIEETRMAVLGITTGWALSQNLLGRPSLADESVRRSFFEQAWAIFLAGVVTR
jgi:AcrR family transcriptional regulator